MLKRKNGLAKKLPGPYSGALVKKFGGLIVAKVKVSMLERSGFYFLKVNSTYQVWEGKPHESESELVMTLHEIFLDRVIAGLTAIRAVS